MEKKLKIREDKENMKIIVADNHYFEGVEKLLEIWFKKRKNSKNNKDLRDIARESWENMLETVKCEIVDKIENNNQVAYILSESSLFVTKDRMTLKTCGTTLCLQSIDLVLELAKTCCDYDVSDCFYSRRNFARPEKQSFPYTTFENEAEFLNKRLSRGTSYRLGSLTGSGWYMWTLNHCNNPSPPIGRPDQTLEVLMTGLDAEVSSQFYKFDPKTGQERTSEEITLMSGISKLIPGSKINSFQFDPCGYSMNGLVEDDEYWTIHITPEDSFSYASFETNIPPTDNDSYELLVKKIYEVFKPKQFCLTIFWNEYSLIDLDYWMKGSGPQLPEMKRINTQITKLQHYMLLYSDYESLDKR